MPSTISIHLHESAICLVSNDAQTEFEPLQGYLAIAQISRHRMKDCQWNNASLNLHGESGSLNNRNVQIFTRIKRVVGKTSWTTMKQNVHFFGKKLEDFEIA